MKVIGDNGPELIDTRPIYRVIPDPRPSWTRRLMIALKRLMASMSR